MNSRTFEYTVMAIFVAVTIVVGFIFIAIPNVEMVTTTIFLSGYALGSRKGLIVGVVAELLYSLLNPIGAPTPPLLIAQLISMGTVGYAGGVLYITTTKVSHPLNQSVQLAISGCTLTLLYDLLTTMSFSLFMGDTLKTILASFISGLIYGLPFYVVHLIGNTLIFAMILPLLIRGLAKIEHFKSRLSLFTILCCSFLLFGSGRAQDPDTLASARRGQFIRSDTTRGLTMVKSDSLRKKIIFESDTSRVRKFRRDRGSLPAQEMRRTIYKDLGDALISIPGAYVQNRGWPGQVALARIGGLTANQHTCIVDGRPFKDPLTGTLDLNLIPVENIEEVVVRGPLESPLYDRVVELTSERYSEQTPYSRVYVHKGPSDFSDVDVMFGQKVSSRADVITGVTIRGFSGPLKPQSYEHHMGRALIRYRHSPRWRLDYSWLYNWVKLHDIGPRDTNGNFATPDARSWIVRHDQTLTLKASAFNSHFQNLHMRFYHSILFNDTSDRSRSFASDDRFQYAGLISELEKKLFFQHLKFGAEAERAWSSGDAVGRRGVTTFSAGMSDLWMPASLVGMEGKIGFAGQNSEPMNLRGGIGAFLRFHDLLKISIGENISSRYPTMYESFADQENMKKEGLEAEKINDIYFDLQSQPFRCLMLKTRFYRNDITDVIDVDVSDESGVSFANRGQRRISGIALHLQSLLGEHLTLNAHINYTHLHSGILHIIPETVARAILDYHDSFFVDDLRMNLRFEGRFWAERSERISSQTMTLPQNYILSLSGFFRIMQSVKAFFSIENILDEDYQLMYGYPMNGRTIHYGLRWEFRD